ncbi:MAG: Holliday junction resolvase RuvX [Bacteroidia bacterium]|nr:Holliday junction resolvase RuvX [Bacteroidia bacterium]
MGRILAIDYGSKRVGVAVTDPIKIIATGLETVHSKDIEEYLKQYIEKEDVELFVVGDPKKLNNQPSESKKLVNAFVNRLKKVFPEIPIELVDERLTSRMAEHVIITSDLKKKDRQKKELRDTISATLILQTYLESKN